MKKPSKILYFGKKALAFLLSVLVLSLAVFYVSRLAPGDPLVSYYGDRAEKLTPQERAQAEEKLGYPMFVKPANAGSSVGGGKARPRRAYLHAVCSLGAERPARGFRHLV